VRACVASLLALFLLTIACTDPLYCADGCDRGGITFTHSTQSGTDCPTCLSAVVPQYEPPTTPVEAVTPMCEQPPPGPLTRLPAKVDHPPRLA